MTKTESEKAILGIQSDIKKIYEEKEKQITHLMHEALERESYIIDLEDQVSDLQADIQIILQASQETGLGFTFVKRVKQLLEEKEQEEEE